MRRSSRNATRKTYDDEDYIEELDDADYVLGISYPDWIKVTNVKQSALAHSYIPQVLKKHI